jgi:hypothetical protein
MSRLFISYSRQDSKEVDPLARRLETAGHKVWIDRSAIQGGERWQQQIVSGIERADVFLIILSPESVQSENVERELGLAYVRNKAILPVMLHRVEVPPRLQYAVAGREIIDLADTADAGSVRLLDTITKPDLRTRGADLERGWHTKARRFLAGAIWVSIFALIDLHHAWPRTVDGLIVIILVCAIAWLARRVWCYRRLKNSGVLLPTDFRGFLGQDPVRIVSECHDPATGRRYQFCSKAVSAQFSEFVETKVPVIVDPKNYKTFRGDLSFLPKEPRGPLGLPCRDETQGAGGQHLPEEKGSLGHIYVSYSEHDDKTVAVLIRKLKASGHTVWATDEANQDDRERQEQVVYGIDGARLFLLILSPESGSSERVLREFELATSKAKRIVAVLLGRAMTIPGMDYALVKTQRVDLSEDFETGMARLLETASAGTPQGEQSHNGGRTVPSISYVERVGEFFGYPSRRRLRAEGTALLTEYKHVYVYSKMVQGGGEHGEINDIIVEARILTQWRHPVSHEVYMFRSSKLPPDVGDSIKTKTITVYVDPNNMKKYYMDLSFLEEDRESVPLKVAHSSQATGRRGIFVVYSQLDKEKADVLMQNLELEGYEIVNRSLTRGELASDEAIQKGIDGAPITLVLVPPPDASDLDETTRELRSALASRGHIIPVAFGDSPTPLSMQLALTGIQLITLSQDPQVGTQPLLDALARITAQRAPVNGSPVDSSHLGSRKFIDKLRRRAIGALLGGLAWAVGSVLPVLLSIRNWKMLPAMGMSGFAIGSACGAIVYMRRLSLRVLALFVALFGFVLFVFAYVLFTSLFAPAESSNGAMLLGAVLGCGTFLLGWVVELRVSDIRLKKTGRLLLTEYKGVRQNMSETHNNRHYLQVVSEWRDPATDEVHVFVSRNFADDPSKLIRARAIRVFVDPTNFKNYYMDLSTQQK